MPRHQPQRPEVIQLDDYELIILVKRDGTTSIRSESSTPRILRLVNEIRQHLVELTAPPLPREKN